ncbi:28S ribosomal protein S10, mitochondrial-like [Penaeus japonicus]|uniref:28S ribosomal protein S10, mitochondrial-like n=1 Tax=Penaeus japonicus TaxID=27405 RepID=UPI001C70DCF3|nr:28S ribosomal protein S10, mitochondrial-like [Penaeus japonicus]
MRSATCLLLARALRNEAGSCLIGSNAVRKSSSFAPLGSVAWLTGAGKHTPSSFPSAFTQTVYSSRRLHSSALSLSSSEVGLAVGEPDKLYKLVEVECRGHEPAVLRSFHTFATTAAGHLEIPVQEVLWPDKHIKRWTLLKSVHIYKKHRVQYEVRTHFLIMKFARLTGSTADTFLEYIQRNLPEGVAMKVTKHELQTLPEHVKPSSEVVV